MLCSYGLVFYSQVLVTDFPDFETPAKEKKKSFGHRFSLVLTSSLPICQENFYCLFHMLFVWLLIKHGIVLINGLNMESGVKGTRYWFSITSSKWCLECYHSMMTRKTVEFCIFWIILCWKLYHFANISLIDQSTVLQCKTTGFLLNLRQI